MTPADNNPQKCFANLHLTPEEYGLWEYLRSVSHSTGIAYLSGRRIASDFIDTNKNAIYRIIDRLFEKSWLEEFSAFYRTKSGMYVPRTAKVLTHDQWVAKYGRADCRPVPKSGQVGPVPVSSLSRNQDTPVPNLGRSCPEIGNNTAVDSAVDSEKVGVVEKSDHPFPEFQNLTPSGKNEAPALLSDLRTIYEHHNLSAVATWNTTPAHAQRVVELEQQYGQVGFLLAFDCWCANDAYDQLETKHSEGLKFPLRKFLSQVPDYIVKSRDPYEAKRRRKPDACPLISECCTENVGVGRRKPELEEQEC
jgi:hypothetical protein